MRRSVPRRRAKAASASGANDTAGASGTCDAASASDACDAASGERGRTGRAHKREPAVRMVRGCCLNSNELVRGRPLGRLGRTPSRSGRSSRAWRALRMLGCFGERVDSGGFSSSVVRDGRGRAEKSSREIGSSGVLSRARMSVAFSRLHPHVASFDPPAYVSAICVSTRNFRLSGRGKWATRDPCGRSAIHDPGPVSAPAAN